ncbi:probable receptor-like protein kinase At1g49730 [Selaginella moellendorffii]|uniref:probable receptor-like protein kinase At1g49730 n=1 Tax=Selaginella moellendorffii TaxID=88036 RepID=UPI000D1C744B|nr:probable receptor-like protein kinase At1g49730 [Selaginella moellendorffii]|eukprot:XP_024529959.1 probable receptor-like protein kinase At1g49730 [Selaginella moellendorffii]
MSLRGQCQCKAAARVRDIVGAPGFEGVVASCESFGGGEMNSSRCSRCSAAATRLAASIAAPNPPRSCQEAVFVALASFEDFKSAMHKASCLFQLQPPKKLTECPLKLTPWQLQNVANVCSSSESPESSCCSVSLLFLRIAASKLGKTSGDFAIPQRLARACIDDLGPRIASSRQRVCSISSDSIANSARRGCNNIVSLRELEHRLTERDFSVSRVTETCDRSSCLECRRAALDAAYAAAWPYVDATTLQHCMDLTFLMLASNASAIRATQIGGCLYALPVFTPEDDVAVTAVSSSSPPPALPPARPEDDVSMSLLPDPINKLAHQSPSPVTIVLAIGIGITGATVAILLVLVLLLQRKREESVPLWNKDSALDVWQGSEALRALRRFKYSEIEKATNHFHSLIGQGRGAASAVYRAKFKDGLVAAVKRFHAAPQPQSEEEFKNEAHFLGRLHHRHLVSLRGFCMRKNERFLVYDFMENGSLKERLHLHHRGRSNGTLSWQRRLQIAIEVATGMEYVHCYCEPPLCHGNLKSSNILLDENFVAKVGDFRLPAAAPFGCTPDSGYVDPEFSHTGVLTEKSDVYSFGVLLLELVSSRPVTTAGDKHILDWAHEFYNFSDARLVEMVDSTLRDQIDPDELKKIITVSRLCSQSEAASRPSMKQVVNLLLDNAIAIFPPLSFSATIKDDDGDGDGDGKQHRRVNSDDSLSIHSATGIPSFSTATSNAKNLFLFSTSPHAPSFSSYSTYSPSYSLRFS